MAASMYVRVKRGRTTVFLHVDPTDTVAQLKARLEQLMQTPPARQRLFAEGGAVLEDGRSLAEAGVENDAVLALALQAEEGGAWEEPNITEVEVLREDS